MRKTFIACAISVLVVPAFAGFLDDINSAVNSIYTGSDAVSEASVDVIAASNTIIGGYANVLASSGVIVQQNTLAGYRLGDNVLRQEALGIAIKLGGSIDLPSSYTCRGYFRDVSSVKPNNWVCRIVELGAENNVISRARADFYPEWSITRSEALAMLMGATGIASANSVQGQFDSDAVEWQKKLVLSAYQKGIISSTLGFYPNRIATRADIIYMAYKIGLYTGIISVNSQGDIIINGTESYNGNWAGNVSVTQGSCPNLTFTFVAKNGLIEGTSSDGGTFGGYINANGYFEGTSGVVSFSGNMTSSSSGSGTASAVNGLCKGNIYFQKN